MVAALYVDRLGPYVGRPDVDPWFIDGLRPEQSRLDFPEAFHFYRDAREYSGPHPVVAHPPCGPWGSLRHMRVPNRERRTGDADCMPFAVDAVRRFGGVLEQPKGSIAFREFGMPHPGESPDAWGGYSIEVEQVRWGHPARKRTWLYLVGVTAPPNVPPPRAPTHWVSGGRKRSRKGNGGVVPPGIKVCSAQQRRRTPPAFADWLISLAKAARKVSP